VWEEDMVATFLASMGTDDVEDVEYLADYGRPSWSEVASVVGLAVRLRVGGVGMPPLSVAWGEAIRAVRLVALVVLLFNAVSATWGMWRMFWLTNQIPGFPAPAQLPALPVDFWSVVWNVVGLLGVVAYLTLVFGQWRAARLFAVLAFLPSVGFAVRDTLATDPTTAVIARWSDVLISALLLLTLTAFHRDTPLVRRRPWLIAFAVGIALTPVLEFVLWTVPMDSQWLLDWAGIGCVLVVTAALVYLAGQAIGRSPVPSWALALALLSFAALVLRTVWLWNYYTLSAPAITDSVPMTLGLVQTAATLAVGLMLAVLAGRSLRRLPLPLDAPRRSD
ncbi:MAG: hypothetical protein LC808_42870, partial [Actinobacteria bacterium]|nr:hypothetical protein [Actinomycetota bacterium]